MIESDPAFEHIVHDGTQRPPSIGAFDRILGIELLNRTIRQMKCFLAVVFDHENCERMNIVSGDTFCHFGAPADAIHSASAEPAKEPGDSGQRAVVAARFAGSEAAKGEEFYIDLLSAIERVVGKRFT